VTWGRTFAAASVLLFGCQGEIGEPSGMVDPTDPGCVGVHCETPSAPAATSEFPRLSHRQWTLTVQDLLHLEEPPGDAESFEGDPRGQTYFDNDGSVLQVTPNLWSDYQQSAEVLAERVTTDASAYERLVGSDSPSVFLRRFLRRAFRRPPTDAEIDVHLGLVDEGPTHYPAMGTDEAGVRLALEAILQSPHFLYRVESGEPNADGDVVLDDHALASRLSYLLWDTMPDDDLFAAADAGSLSGEGLREHAFRMLDDERATDKMLSFHEQLLELDAYGRLDGAGASMQAEAERFLEEVVLETDGGVRELLTAPFTYVNDELAAIYGLEGSFGSELERVELDPAQRGGLFTQPGFLASHAGETAPIHRGVFLNLRVLCANLPEPPTFTPPDPRGTTRRERIDSVTGYGTCGETCHGGVINPIGFAFEGYDDLGAWRTEDSGEPVDDTDAYAFGGQLVEFDGAVELGHAMAESPEAHECYVQNWIEYAFGRPLQRGDLGLIEDLGAQSRTDGISVKEILVALVDSEHFRKRRDLPASEDEEEEE